MRRRPGLNIGPARSARRWDTWSRLEVRRFVLDDRPFHTAMRFGFLLGGEAAIDEQASAGDKSGGVTGQEDGSWPDLGGLTPAPQGDL